MAMAATPRRLPGSKVFTCCHSIGVAGIGRLLLAAVEDWARGRGLSELGSDAELDNLTVAAQPRPLGI